MRPKNGLIILVIAIGILNCELRFANATQTTNGLGECCATSLLELSMQLSEKVFAPDEEDVAWEGDIPDGGEIGAGEAGGE
jgi:hypothetical protein